MTLAEKQLALARAWLEKADGDLETARTAIGNPRIPCWIIGFHLQQALEKAWKGRLVLMGIRAPAVHDLRALLQARAPDAGPADKLLPLIEALQPFAVEERYPLFSPRDAERESLVAVLPLVEAELGELLRTIGD